MNNISQITNFSSEVTSSTIETIPIYIGNSTTSTNVAYYVIPASTLTGSQNISINKLGYICEPKGIDYPIVITTDGQDRIFYLGKTGMFETAPETFLDINDTSATELDCTPEITKVKVPKGIAEDESIKFKLDYTFTS